MSGLEYGENKCLDGDKIDRYAAKNEHANFDRKDKMASSPPPPCCKSPPYFENMAAPMDFHDGRNKIKTNEQLG